MKTARLPSSTRPSRAQRPRQRSLSRVLRVALLAALACACAAQAGSSIKAADLSERSVPDLVRMLQIGGSSQKAQAAQALGEKAYRGDTAVNDAIPALLQVMRCMNGGKPSEEAAVALSKFGLPAAERLRDEVSGASKQGNSSSRLLAVRALGLMGPPARELAEPLLLVILDSPRRSLTTRDPLVNEAAVALASVDAALQPKHVPEVVAAMNACKDPDVQTAMAIYLITAPGERERFANDVSSVLVRSSARLGLDLAKRQRLLDAMVSLNTPACMQGVLAVLGSPRTMTGDDREAAANALAKMRPPSHQALEGLVRALETDRSPQVLRAACRALGDCGGAASEAVPHLEAFIKGLAEKRNLDGGERDKPNIARTAQRALDQIRANGARPALAATSPGEPAKPAPAAGQAHAGPEFNSQVVIALELVSRPSESRQRLLLLEPLLLQALYEPSLTADLRPEIVRGLVRIQTSNAVDAVCGVLTTPAKHDYKVRSAAAKHLAELSPPTQPVLDALVAALKSDPSPCVVSAACKTLAAYGAKAEPAFQSLKECLQTLPQRQGLENGDRDKPLLELTLKESISKVREAVADEVLGGAPPVN